MGVHNHVCLSCNGRPLYIYHCQHFSSLFMCQMEGSLCVCRLTGLGNHDNQIIRCDNRVSVSKFGCNIYRHFASCQFFDYIFSNHACMHGCTTCHNKNLSDIFQTFFRNAALRKIRHTIHDSRRNGGLYCGRLFVDFLQHKMLITTFFRCIHVQIRNFYFFYNFLFVDITKFHSVSFDCGNLIFF